MNRSLVKNMFLLPDMPTDPVSIPEAARRLKRSTITVRAWVRLGKIPVHRVGNACASVPNYYLSWETTLAYARTIRNISRLRVNVGLGKDRWQTGTEEFASSE